MRIPRPTSRGPRVEPFRPEEEARKRPELRFFLETIDNLIYQADFSIAGTLFRETGPVTISIFINNHLLDTVTCAEAGEKHFEKPVPPKWLRAKALNFAAMEIDKVWVRNPMA
jgi:hypothetical protein